jgi:hypothetical protein
MADVRPLAIDDTDSIIRTFHLELHPQHNTLAEAEAPAISETQAVAAA